MPVDPQEHAAVVAREHLRREQLADKKAEIAQLRADKDAEILRLRTDKEAEAERLTSQSAAVVAAKEAEVMRFRADKEAEMTQLRMAKDAENAQLRADKDMEVARLTALVATKDAEIARLTSQNATLFAYFQSEKDAEKARLTTAAVAAKDTEMTLRCADEAQLQIEKVAEAVRLARENAAFKIARLVFQNDAPRGRAAAAVSEGSDSSLHCDSSDDDDDLAARTALQNRMRAAGASITRNHAMLRFAANLGRHTCDGCGKRIASLRDWFRSNDRLDYDVCHECAERSLRSGSFLREHGASFTDMAQFERDP